MPMILHRWKGTVFGLFKWNVGPDQQKRELDKLINGMPVTEVEDFLVKLAKDVFHTTIPPELIGAGAVAVKSWMKDQFVAGTD